MEDKKEVRKLMKFAKKILSQEVYQKLRNLDRNEKEQIIKHAINARLYNDFEELQHRKDEMKKQGKDVFFIETGLHSLNGKMRLFTATYHKQDFANFGRLFSKISKEIKNG